MTLTTRDQEIEQLIEAWSRRGIVDIIGPVDEFDDADDVLYRAAAAAYDHLHHTEGGGR